MHDLRHYFLVIWSFFRSFATRMREVQLIGVVLTAMMALALMTLLPPKVKEDRTANRSRWMMTAGLLLLGVQFLLQYLFGFREMGIVQAVMLNLMMLIPVSALLALSILNLQRQGQVGKTALWIGIPTWLVTMAIVAGGSQHLVWAEVAASGVFCMMQLFYAKHIVSELKRMKQVLNDYFDCNQDGLLRWMQVSIVTMTVIALTAPFCIFLPPQWLIVFVALVLGSISYMWFCFVRYVMTSAASHMREAEGSEKENHGPVPLIPDMQHIRQAVEQLTSRGCHLHNGIRRDVAAKEMGVPSRQLSAWVKASGYDSYSKWITALRIKEAKRLLSEHPDWSIEAIADQCGISRTHFYKVFKDETNQLPAEFLASLSGTAERIKRNKYISEQNRPE